MKTLLLILLCTLSTLILNGKHRYGFGYIAVFNPLGDGRYTKELFLSKVIDLDSLCRNANLSQKMKRKSKRYFECTGLWVIETVKSKHPDVIRSDSEIDNLSRVERSSRFRYSASIKRMSKKDVRKMNAHHKTVFTDREKAERLRKEFTEAPYNDVDTTFTLL